MRVRNLLINKEDFKFIPKWIKHTNMKFCDYITVIITFNGIIMCYKVLKYASLNSIAYLSMKTLHKIFE